MNGSAVIICCLRHSGAATRAIHLGQHEAGLDQFPVPALICNSAALLDSVEAGRDMLGNAEGENFAYQRYANPTVSVLEAKFRAIEPLRLQSGSQQWNDRLPAGLSRAAERR